MYRPLCAIFVFMVLFGSFHWIKPSITYTNMGTFRPFGIGTKQKTVISAWVVAIIIAIFSYLAVLRMS